MPGYDATITDPNLTPAALASFQAFTTAEQQMARDALSEWGSNSGLIFIEVAAGQGDINFQKLDFSGTGYDGAGGIAYRPFGDWNFFTYPYFSSDLDSSGDVFMNSDIPVSYGTLLHEIGHALGLKHPTEAWTNYAADPDVTHNVWTTDDPALTIIASRHSAIFTRHASQPLAPALGEFRLNPLYAAEPEGDQVRLRLRFPTEEYEEEYGACRQYLPDDIAVDRELLDQLPAPAVSGTLADLARRRVVLDLPKRYY